MEKGIPKVGDWVTQKGWDPAYEGQKYWKVCKVDQDRTYLEVPGYDPVPYYHCDWIFRDEEEPEPAKLLAIDVMAHAIIKEGEKVKRDAVVMIQGARYNELMDYEAKYKALLSKTVQQLVERV